MKTFFTALLIAFVIILILLALYLGFYKSGMIPGAESNNHDTTAIVDHGPTPVDSGHKPVAQEEEVIAIKEDTTEKVPEEPKKDDSEQEESKPQPIKPSRGDIHAETGKDGGKSGKTPIVHEPSVWTDADGWTHSKDWPYGKWIGGTSNGKPHGANVTVIYGEATRLNKAPGTISSNSKVGDIVDGNFDEGNFRYGTIKHKDGSTEIVQKL